MCSGGAWRTNLRLFLVGAAAIVGAMVVAGCGAATISAGDGPGASVLLLPETNAGWVGWCFLPVGVSGGACGNGDQRAPVIEEHWNGGDAPHQTVGVAVTSDQVARVAIGEARYGEARLLGGKSVPTRSESGLPAGLRVVLARIDGTNLLGFALWPSSFHTAECERVGDSPGVR
jgi:hypothetical protein